MAKKQYEVRKVFLPAIDSAEKYAAALNASNVYTFDSLSAALDFCGYYNMPCTMIQGGYKARYGYEEFIITRAGESTEEYINHVMQFYS